METKKWAVAIGNFGDQYSLVISSWELDEDGNRINQNNQNIIVDTVEKALTKALQIVNS
jgi:hypothetical protein